MRCAVIKYWMHKYWIDTAKRGVANVLSIPLDEIDVTVSENGTHLNVNILHHTLQISEPFITTKLLKKESERQGINLTIIKTEIIIRKACYDSDVT